MSMEEELPPGWCWSTVGEVGEVRLGRQRSPSNRSNHNPVKYLRAANITWEGLNLSEVLDMDFTPAEQEVFRLKPGDVLLSEASGSAKEVGKPAVWRDEIENCCFQNTVIRFRSKCVEPSYSLLAFNHLARNGLFAKVSKGVGIQHLSADRFAQIPFPLPPAREQLRIVEKAEEMLSDLDAGVKLLERARANLKKYRAAVLKAAVTGELTADWRAAHPDVEPASQLLDRILTERRQKWEADQQAKFTASGKTPPKGWKEKYPEPGTADPTKLFALPDGWTWAVSLQVCERVESGSTPAADKMTPDVGEIPFIKVYNLTATGRLNFAYKPTFVSNETHQGQLARSRIAPGDVLMNIVGPPLGKVSLVPDDYPEWNMNQAVVLFRPMPGLFNRYLMLCLLADDVLGWITRQAKATAGQCNISVSMSRELPIPLPPGSEQEVILEEVERQLSAVNATENYIAASLKRAGRLRQSILKEAFAGQLVPQDPSDEPASVLLDRIRQARATTNGTAAVTRPRRSRKTAAPSAEAADGRT